MTDSDYQDSGMINHITYLLERCNTEKLNLYGVASSKITDEQKIKLANETFKTINELFYFKK